MQLLVTFDVVTHPGFSNAEMNKIINPELLLNDEFTNLNENNINLDFYSFITYSDNNENVSTEKLFENNNYLFETKRLSIEEKIEEKNDADILEKNEPTNKNSVENKLQTAVQIQLKESDNELKKRINSGTYYDNSSGFKTEGLDGVKIQNQVGMINQSKKLRK